MRDWHLIVIKDKEVMDKLLNIVPKEFSDNDLNELFTKTAFMQFQLIQSKMN